MTLLQPGVFLRQLSMSYTGTLKHRRAWTLSLYMYMNTATPADCVQAKICPVWYLRTCAQVTRLRVQNTGHRAQCTGQRAMEEPGQLGFHHDGHQT